MKCCLNNEYSKAGSKTEGNTRIVPVFLRLICTSFMHTDDHKFWILMYLLRFYLIVTKF